MQAADYLVIVLYITGIVASGMVFARQMKSSKDMFAAGGQSPWWVAGLSAFMTMFSAGTFVVWGGVAYKFGFVAVVINMSLGVSGLLVGWFLSGYWRKLGVDSAAEFLQLRFGPSIVQFYTWFQGTVGIFSIGAAIYALSKIACALMPLPEGHLLADPETGMLSVTFTSVTLCFIVMVITFSGGLWAVLMTDVLQFIILAVSVVFVVPLILMEVGGWDVFVSKVPAGFTSPVAGDFTWWFMAGWVIVHFFKIGAEWSYVQRYACVPSEKDARRVAWVFGVMYLISPLFWMLPALIFRAIEPNADAEQAYILACQSVLPAGMMGLMVAAMASATASAATSQLNVYAGAFTTEVYQKLINPDASEKRLVFVGRIVTMVLGGIVIAGAMLIPRYGYTRFIIDTTALLTGPLVLPTIWGMFSRRIGVKAVWGATLIGFIAAAIVKFGLCADGFLTGIDWLAPVTDWVASNQRIADLAIGIMVPLIVLAVFEKLSSGQHPRWERVIGSMKKAEETHRIATSDMPVKMVAITLGMIGLVMVVLAVLGGEQRGVLLGFAAVLLAVSAAVFYVPKKMDR